MSIINLLQAITPLIFIGNIIYFIKNRSHLLKDFDEKKSNNFMELIYYSINLFYCIFILFGLFTGDYFFIVLFLSYFIKFPIYHLNRRFYVVYSYLYPYIMIAILLCMSYTKLF